MVTKVHFINVGQGNMTLLELTNGEKFLYDCNITGDNEGAILNYVARQIGEGTKIDVLICSDRDADHMRGVKKFHKHFPIQHVWDSGVVGTTADSPEYWDYMDLRRTVGYTEVKSQTQYDGGNTRLLIMNSKNGVLASDANAQSIVIKVLHRNSAIGADYDSVLLCGDTDAAAWKAIGWRYKGSELKCSLLLASHHGAITYFQDPSYTDYYTAHLKAKSPAMTIISVGDNSFGHPDRQAMMFYEQYSTGSNQGYKVFRTDKQGNMRVELKDGGGWLLTYNI
jgi:competence protein ComEC